jgi:hypothetical protein
MIDEEAIAAVGRNAACRRVRMLQISEVFEVGHDVPETRRRETKPAGFGECPRADRLPARDMLEDDLVQHLAGAAVEIFAVDIDFLGHGPR